MADRSYFGFTGKRVPRWLAGTTAAAIVMLGMPALTIAPASAAAGVLGGFEIDGNMAVDNPPNIDWETPSVSAAASKAADKVGNAEDSVYQTSSKETDLPATWTKGTSNIDPKNDIGGYWAWSQTVGSDQWFYFAFDRAAPSGTGYFYLELNQQPNVLNDDGTLSVPNRKVGDGRVTFHDQGNGSLTLDAAEIWDGSAWQPADGGLPAGTFLGEANTAPLTLPAGYTSPNAVNGVIPTDQFLEVGFNVAKLGLRPSCPSTGFGTANFRNATGQSNVNLKDYLAPISINVPSTCSALQIVKKDGNGALLGGATFHIVKNPLLDPPSGWLDVTDNDANDSDPTPGKILITGVQPDQTYTITELTPPTGYIGSSASFPVTTVAGQTADPVTFTNNLGSVAWTKKDHTSGALLGGATFEVKATGGAAAAAPWNLDTNPITVVDNGPKDQDPADGKFSVVGLPTGDYQVTETAAPVGYKIDSTVGTFSISSTTPAGVTGHGTTPYVFDDVRNTGSLTVEKLNSATGAVVTCPTLTGCATFDLYKSAGPTDANFTLYQSGITVGADGTATITDLPWDYYYFFRETAAPTGYNLPDNIDSAHHRITGAEADSVTSGKTAIPVLSVSDPLAGLTTQALTPVTLPGNTITDTVTLTGLNKNAAGAVTFSLYGPFSSNTLTTVCTGTPVFTTTLNVSNPTNGTFTGTSAAYTPTKVGYYYWLASYSGDLNGNRAIAGTCGDPTEISEVKPAVGDIVTTAYPTTASQPHLPSAQLYDNVALTGLTADASGTVTFTVYGPYADGVVPNCSVDAPKATFTVSLPTTGDRSSVSLNSYADTAHGTNGYFVPTTVGTYFWKAVYSGDDNNVGRTEVCGTPGEDTKVLKAVTSTATESSQVSDEVASQKLPGVTVGDTATVTGLNTGVTAGGDVTFRLYGPVVDGICPAQALYTSSPVALQDNGDGTGTASVSGVPVVNAGTYYWTATYSGDANNLGSHDSCGEASEKIVVTPATPTIATTATSGQLPNASIHDSATLTGLTPNVDTTKKVTFSLYGPADPTCSATPVFTSAVALSSGSLVNGVWTGTSASYTATLAGDYHWIASYEGDANNAAVSGACGDQGETSTVTKATTSIVTQATDGAAPLGSDPSSTTTVSDSATVSGLTADAAGTVTFTLYGPVTDGNAANPCLSGQPPLNNVYWTSSAIPLSAVSGGVATASTGPVTVSLPAGQNLGYFFWVASYSGDKNNLTVSGVCPDPTERSMVTRTGIPHLDKSSPTENTTVLPGDTIHYVVTLSNTGGLPVTSNLVDTLPAGVTPVNGTFTKDGSAFAPTSVVGGVITWSNVTVNAGQTVVFAYDVTVNSDVAAGTLTNTATWAGQSDHTVHTVAPAVPSLDKSSPTEFGSQDNASGNVLPGDTIHYVLTLGNTGGAQVTSDLVDTLPSWVTNPRNFEVTTGTYSPAIPSISGSTLTWADVTLGHDQTMVVEFDVTVAAEAPAGDLINHAAWAGLTDTTKHVVAPGVPTFDKSSPTELGSTQNPTGVVLPGSTVHYVLTMGNTGAAAVTSDLVDTLPTWVSSPSNFQVTHGFVVSATPALSNGGQTLTWPSVTVPHGDSVVIEFDAVVSPDAPAGNLVNSATWDELVDTTTHVVEPGVPGIDKSSPTEKGSEGNPSGVVLPGDTIDYTVTVTNTGGAAVTSDLVDTLPAGVTVVPGSFNVDPESIDNNGTVITWVDVKVAAGQSVSFTFQVTVDANVAAGDLVNTATWAGKSDSTVHVVEPGVPHIDKSSPTEKGSQGNPSGDVIAGKSITYTVSISNTGGSELTSDLVDTLPAGVVPVDGSFSTPPDSFDGTTLVWKDITLAPGETFTVTYEVIVDRGHASGELRNDATWSGQSDHTVHELTPGVPGLDKSSPTEQGSVNNPTGNVNPGNTVHYSILLSNTGGTAITKDLVDTLPAGVTPVAGTFSPSEPTINGSTLTWSKVTVGANSTVQFTYDVTVDPTVAAGSLVNNASWDELTDKTTHNVVVQPVLAPNPTLVKTADPATGTAVERGTVVTYTVKVGNTGNGPAMGDLVDTLPAGVDPVAGSFTKDGAAFAPDSITATTITWKNVTVQPGQTITFTYQVTVLSDAVGPDLVNTAKWLGLVSSTSHPLTIPQLPRTGSPFDPVSVALWASLLLALGVMFLVFGRRNDEYEG